MDRVDSNKSKQRITGNNSTAQTRPKEKTDALSHHAGWQLPAAGMVD
jgi:hypothetical protein